MDFAEYQFENKDQFWDELDDLLSRQVYSSNAIEAAVVSFLRFVSTFMEDYVSSNQDLLSCCYKFIDCPAFQAHRIQVRRILITTLVQNCNQLPTPIALLIGVLLLVDGRQHTDTFQMMGEENACPVVIEMLWRRKDEEARVHSFFMELLYEMCRVQRLQVSDIESIPEEFIEYLFACVEANEDYDVDPYSYSFIRIILVLNEQYMLLSNSAKVSSQEPLDNKIIRVLSEKGNTYKTFGTNIIILLNREEEPSLQLLILKMLYQLFTHESTQEYFYTNDLTVLVDVFIRDLTDIPDDAETLRHTFLRVLHPLLAYTQLRQTHYKRDEIVQLLQSLSGQSRVSHYMAVSETTKRLVKRCMEVPWIEPYCPSTMIDHAASFVMNGIAAVARKPFQSATNMIGSNSSHHNRHPPPVPHHIGTHYTHPYANAAVTATTSQLALPDAVPAIGLPSTMSASSSAAGDKDTMISVNSKSLSSPNAKSAEADAGEGYSWLTGEA